MNLQIKTAMAPRQRSHSLTLNKTCASMVNKAAPNNTVQTVKKSTPTLQDKALLRMAQRAAKRGGNYGWSMAVHFAKLAYGLKSTRPAPVASDVWGNFIFTYEACDLGGWVIFKDIAPNQGMRV